MENSILKTIRPMIGGMIDDTGSAFDNDLIVHINTAISILNQLGVGPKEGFAIEDDSATWSDFIGNRKDLSSIKSYIYIRTLLMFDPSRLNTGLVNSLEAKAKELEWRLNAAAESSYGVEIGTLMFDYTDLQLTLTIDAEYLSKLENVYVTLKSKSTEITIKASSMLIDYETGDITVELTQDQTAKLSGKTIVQVNGFLNGKRWASDQGQMTFRRNLLNRVIADE